MAKKNRSNALFSNKNITETNIQSTETVQQIDTLKTMPGQESRLTTENKEKIEQFDNLQNTNSDLYMQNSELTEKIAEYISELSSLRTENKEVQSLSSQVFELSSELLKKTNEIDQYLIRISELTFENARLRASLQNITTQSNNEAPAKSNPVKCIPIQQKRTFNGYESWN